MCQPRPPSATATAGAQTGANLQTAIGQQYLNNVNQVTPFGSQTSTVTGYNTIKGPDGKDIQIPQFTQTTTLSPEQQGLYNTQMGTQQSLAQLASDKTGRLRETLGAEMGLPQYNNFSNGPQLQTQIANAGPIQGNIANAGPIQKQLADQNSWGRVQDVESALFQRYNSQLEQDRQRLETQLANQGVRVGSTAWDRAMDSQARNVNDARLGITINAGQEQNRMQQLALNSGNFANAAQQQQYGQNAGNAAFANQAQAQQFGQNAQQAAFGNAANQQMYGNQFNANQANNNLQDASFTNDIARRNQLLNEQSSLMTGGQVGMPQFGQTPQSQVAGTDIAGLINQQYQQQLGANNSMWGGIGQAASSFLPFLLSDERTKENKVKIGTMGKGIDLYAYNYIGDKTPRFGPMAQDVEKKVPDAVATRPDGLKQIHVPKLTMALGAK